MSRRHPVEDDWNNRRLAPFNSVDVIDPAGHRVWRFLRPWAGVGDSASDADRRRPRYVPSRQPAGCQMRDTGGPTLAFVCKACRDQGRPPTSSLDAAAVDQVFDDLEALSRVDNTPKAGTVHTRHGVAALHLGQQQQ